MSTHRYVSRYAIGVSFIGLAASTSLLALPLRAQADDAPAGPNQPATTVPAPLTAVPDTMAQATTPPVTPPPATAPLEDTTPPVVAVPTPKPLPPLVNTAPPPSLTRGDGTPVPQTIVAPSGKTLTLTFDDEFDPVTDKDGKPYIDRRKWQTTFWQGSSQRTLWGNNEAEYYTDKDYSGDWKLMPDQDGVLNPFSFETPGVLTIDATKVPQELWKKYYMGEERCFSSGLLISDHRFNFQYGYITGRFKLPNNRGAWPAFWLLGDDPTGAKDQGAAHHWGPEVDIFEFFGHRPTKHSAGIIGVKGEKLPWRFGFNEVGYDITKDFHTWGLEWNADNMIFTFDGQVWEKTVTPESFKHPMYLLINLAVGGRWYSQEMGQLGTPYKPWEVDETTMPWKMECNYVRVYQ